MNNMESLRPEFQNSLNLISNLRNTNFSEEFHKNSAGILSSVVSDAAVGYINDLTDNCDLLSSRLNLFPYENTSAQFKIFEFIYTARELNQYLDSSPIRYYSVAMKISALKTASDALVKFVSKRGRLEDYFIDRTDAEAGSSLDDYIKSAVVIRSDQSYNGSPLAELENLILHPRSTIIRLLGEAAIKDQQDNLDTAFIALAAPSFEGKTQAAFVMREAIPLYFPMIVESEEPRILQPIYRKFSRLSNAIKKYAKMDLDAIDPQATGERVSGRYESVSRSEISTNFKDMPFLVLEFLVALMEDSNRTYFERPADQRPDSWMRYHAQRGGFKFEAISINDLISRGFDFGNYFLFLDEFEDENWNLLIRNIARAVKLRCMVSNTNTSIASLTGRSNVLFSRGNPDYVLSIVVRSLNPINYDILTSLFPQTLIEKINQ